jgi:enoyl-[acyl-carrier protein] reductase III
MMLEGRKALVTGGSRGIGRAIALRLAAEGADVIVNYVSQPKAAQEVVERIQRAGRVASAIRADVGREADLETLFATVTDTWGSLDIFVSNAVDVCAFGPVSRARLDAWRHTVDSHLTPLVVAARHAAGLMRGQAGSIVAVSSLGGRVCLRDYAAVGVGKAALEALTRYLAVELAPLQIGVNAVCAGPIDTNALRAFRTFQATKTHCERSPGGRLGTPDDIAMVVAFLCSDAARWIVGQTIVADGGVSLLSGIDAVAEVVHGV